MKKFAAFLMILSVSLITATGCGKKDKDKKKGDDKKTEKKDGK